MDGSWYIIWYMMGNLDFFHNRIWTFDNLLDFIRLMDDLLYWVRLGDWNMNWHFDFLNDWIMKKYIRFKR
jgi:hypothetical protein